MSGRVLHPAGIMALGVLLMLGAWIGPSIWKVRLQRRQTLARAGARALVQAAQRFYADAGVWPASREGISRDGHFGEKQRNAELINILRSVDGPGNEEYSSNPNRTVYFSPPEARPGRPGVDARGEFLDSWGTAYRVVLDSDLNGICEVENSVYDGQLGVGILVWSCGPDRRSDTRDDILSWKPELRRP